MSRWRSLLKKAAKKARFVGFLEAPLSVTARLGSGEGRINFFLVAVVINYGRSVGKENLDEYNVLIQYFVRRNTDTDPGMIFTKRFKLDARKLFNLVNLVHTLFDTVEIAIVFAFDAVLFPKRLQHEKPDVCYRKTRSCCRDVTVTLKFAFLAVDYFFRLPLRVLTLPADFAGYCTAELFHKEPPPPSNVSSRRLAKSQGRSTFARVGFGVGAAVCLVANIGLLLYAIGFGGDAVESFFDVALTYYSEGVGLYDCISAGYEALENFLLDQRQIIAGAVGATGILSSLSAAVQEGCSRKGSGEEFKKTDNPMRWSTVRVAKPGKASASGRGSSSIAVKVGSEREARGARVAAMRRGKDVTATTGDTGNYYTTLSAGP
jgi:hypothetical protein